MIRPNTRFPTRTEPETAYEVDKTRNVYLEGLAEEAIQARQQAEREAREAVERAADTETRLRERARGTATAQGCALNRRVCRTFAGWRACGVFRWSMAMKQCYN
jgi:hypothetical protein